MILSSINYCVYCIYNYAVVSSHKINYDYALSYLLIK